MRNVFPASLFALRTGQPHGPIPKDDMLVAGVDVGSTQTKAIIVNENMEIVARGIEHLGFRRASSGHHVRQSDHGMSKAVRRGREFNRHHGPLLGP